MKHLKWISTLILILALGEIHAGSNTLATKNEGDIISSDDVNQYKSAFTVDIVPRNSSGVATTNGGELGTSSLKFKRANVTTGYLFVGQVIMFHDFNGTVSPGQGWMKCNGDVINETNYDAIHGAGSWDTYVVSSSLDGKHTPDMNSRYPVGVTNTTQTGSSAITSVGNTGHQVALPNHTHSTPSHNHQWYNNDAATARTYDTNGDLINIPGSSSGAPTSSIRIGADAGSEMDGNAWTADSSGTTGNPSAATISHQPESIQFEFWIRII